MIYHHILALSSVFIFLISSVSLVYGYIPPTNAFEHAITSNSTVHAYDYEGKLNIIGKGNTVVTGSDLSKSIYITSSAASGKNGTNGTNGTNGINGTTISPITCSNNYQLHGLTVSGTTGTLHCAANNSTGSSITLDTIQNIGTGGYGFYKTNNTNTNFQFKNLTSDRSDLISISTDSNNVNLNSNFKEPDIDCGAGHFLRKLVNSTGFTCGAESGGTITTGTNLGTSGIGVFAGVSGPALTFFKLISANSNCIYSVNATNVILTCSIGGITSINGQTGPAYNIVGTLENVTVTNSTNQAKLNLGDLVVITNGDPQTIKKLITFKNQAKIYGLLLNATSKANSYTIDKLDDLILVNATNGNMTITLPSIATTGNGKIFTVKKIDYSKNYVEIIPTSSTIDYFNNINITNPMNSLQIQNNGTTWFTLNKQIYTDTNNQLKNSINSWFGSWVNQGTPTTFAPVNNTLYAVPFKLSRSTSLAKIESEITTFGANSNCRMAIYTDSGSGYPLNKVLNSDVGALSTQTTSTRTIINNFTNNIKLPEGQYYLAEDCNYQTVSGNLVNDTIASTSGSIGTGSQSKTLSINVASHNNRVLVVGVTNRGLAFVPSTPTVKIGTTSFTQAIDLNNGASTGDDSAIFYLSQTAGLGTGSQTVTVTWSEGGGGTYGIGAYSIYNVNQTSPIGATGSNSGISNSVTVSVTPTHTSAWILDTDTIFSVASTPVAAQIQAWNNKQSTSDYHVSQYKTNPTINSPNALTWSSVLSGQWNAVAVELVGSGSSGNLPVVRGIPSSSLGTFLGIPNSMGATNGGTMYSTTYIMGSNVNSLPDPFPTTATIATTSVPEILINVVG